MTDLSRLRDLDKAAEVNTIRIGNDSRSGWGLGAGEVLVRRRRAMGLTQEEVAQRSALSVRTISDLERGHTRRPRPRSLRLLAAALDLNQAEVAHLLELARNNNRGDFYPDVGLDV